MNMNLKEVLFYLFFTILISTARSSGFIDNLDMNGLMCYQCIENPQEDGRMQCQVHKDEIVTENHYSFLENFMEKYVESSDDDNVDDDIEQFIEDHAEKMLSPQTNPCKVMTHMVLQLVQSQEKSVLPIYLDLDGKDSKTKYQELKETISTIQFQKRENSKWMTVVVEVQFRKMDEPFSFILPDFEFDFFSIQQNSIFYTSL